MKIMVNYDFFKRVKYLNTSDSKLTLFKIRTEDWLVKELPLFSFFNFLLTYPKLSYMVYFDMLGFLLFNFGYEIKAKKLNCDLFALRVLRKYRKQLAKLSSQFNNLNIHTDYDLLLETELYYKETKLVFSKGLPDIVEKKYYNVPSYTITGDIEPVSIEQEHVVGSKEYVLTLGSPSKIHDYAPNPI